MQNYLILGIPPWYGQTDLDIEKYIGIDLDARNYGAIDLDSKNYGATDLDA